MTQWQEKPGDHYDVIGERVRRLVERAIVDAVGYTRMRLVLVVVLALYVVQLVLTYGVP